MDIHHHSKRTTEKKHAKEYFSEFLMLFLAITLGFFSENAREHFVENARAKEYAQSLYDDLKTDSMDLSRTIKDKVWLGSKTDSITSILRSSNIQTHANLIYYYHSFLDLNLSFTPNDVTIQQLRNSGNLRYFKNPELYKQITRYYNGISWYLNRENNLDVKIPISLSARLFRSDILMSNRSPAADPKNSMRVPLGNPQLLTTDPQILNEYLMYVEADRTANNLLVILLRRNVETNLKKLMAELKNEYHLQ